jgi:hypothetical protein
MQKISEQIRMKNTDRFDTEEIRSHQEPDQKGPADQEGAPRKNTVEDTGMSAPDVLSDCKLCDCNLNSE